MLSKDPDATAKYLNQVRFSNKSNFIRSRSTTGQFTHVPRTSLFSSFFPSFFFFSLIFFFLADDWSSGTSIGPAGGKKMR